MYVLTVQKDFSAAHRLPSSGGKCERLHGHNWKVEVEVEADALDERGMVVDFHDLKSLVREVLAELDHRFLNDLDAFRRLAPTAENLARHIFAKVEEALPAERARLARVRVWESDNTAAAFSAPRPDAG